MKYISKTALMLIVACFVISSCTAQLKNAKTETLKVYGNCGMCKKAIETAAYQKGETVAQWNKDTKVLLLKYDSTQTNSKKILRRIAEAGYDNEDFTAPDDAYNKLPECCQYNRKAAAVALVPAQITTISTTETVKTTPVTPNDPTKTATVTTTETVKTTPVTPNDPTKTATVTTTKTVKTEIEKVPPVMVKNRQPLTEVYAAYFGLKDALVKSDGNIAATQAKVLYKAIDQVDMNKITEQEHTVWMKYAKQLSYHTEHIKGTTEVEHQREHFIDLSKNMYEVMKVIKTEIPVYYDHCPMANDGKGADWLSLDKPIKNPYFGKAMLSCGSIIETIK